MRAVVVPEVPSPDITELVELLRGRRFVAVAGAGCSTESGIPDYRGPTTRARARSPVQYRTFIRHEAARTRYWARSVVGWTRFRSAEPGPAHFALAELERTGPLQGLITQNVDRLHHAAGSERVIELHGALAEVRCLDCGRMEPRDALQSRLLALNPGWQQRHAELAPDGDAELPAEWVAQFRTAGCLGCGGVLKPNVVFFGENVPKPRVGAAWSLMDEADALVVVGSSLAVFSGYRFVREAAARGMPVAIINAGPTRADELADVRVEARLGEVLPRLVDSLPTRA
jgi:NAD-dependent SIR2 family protein deacetylase